MRERGREGRNDGGRREVKGMKEERKRKRKKEGRKEERKLDPLLWICCILWDKQLVPLQILLFSVLAMFYGFKSLSKTVSQTLTFTQPWV